MENIKKELSTFKVGPRLQALRAYWDQNFADVDVILIKDGRDADGVLKIKTIAMHAWIFRIELLNTLIAITSDKIIVLGSTEKLETLKVMAPNFEEGGFHLLPVPKTDDIAGSVASFIQHVKDNTTPQTDKKVMVGALLKEKQKGKFIEEFETQMEASGAFDHQEIGAYLQDLFSVKRAEDLPLISQNSKAVQFFYDKLIGIIEDAIDQQKPISHFQVSSKMEDLLQQHEKDLAFKYQIKPSFFDLSYTPIVQSGGKYDLKPTATSDDNPLKHDCIMLSLGCKYFEYNTNVVRTLFINASPREKQVYMLCYAAHEKLIKLLRPGAVLKDVYHQVRDFMLEKDGSLAGHLPTNFGFGIGLEFRESVLLINQRNEGVVKPNMVFNVLISLKDMQSPKRAFAVQIVDTVVVHKDSNEVLTASIDKDYKNIGYQLEDEEEDTAEQQKRNERREEYLNLMKQRGVGPLTRSKRRGAQKAQDTETYMKIAEHQGELLEAKCKELEERLERGESIQPKSMKNQIELQKICSYKTKQEIPRGIPSNSIYVDMRNDTVLMPVYGVLSAFHISVIKNVSKQDEGKLMSLRFNFNYPKTASSTNILYPNPKNLDFHPIYIKELIFRSVRTDHLLSVFKEVKELQKSYKQKEITDETNIGPQNLIEARGKRPILKSLRMRPALRGRKTMGMLECHENGFKFISRKNDQLIILFSNIKHAFYQPCDGEMIILIHFHLKNAIVVGKKKVVDVQFYSESGATSEDLTDSRRRMNEFNEEEQEQIEREQKMRLNQKFEDYVRAIEAFSKRRISFDVPYKELGFTGSYNSNNVLIVPTLRCLVHLTHSPFFVSTLEEVEVAFFERLAPTIKNFDLVLIFNDYTRFSLINAIPNMYKDRIRQWLDSCNILFFESTVNTKWDAMLKRIRNDFDGFVLNDHGWKAFADNLEEDESLDGENPVKRADSDFDSNDFDQDELDDDDDSGFSDMHDEDEEVIEEDSLEEEDEISEEEDEDSRPRKRVKG